MSSIVADELAKIKSFETDTEKRRSELTLNELNYISDKQLHKKDGGGGDEQYFDLLLYVDPNGVSPSETFTVVVGDYDSFKEIVLSNGIPKVAAASLMNNRTVIGTTTFWFDTYNMSDDYMTFTIKADDFVSIYWLPDGTWSLVAPTNTYTPT